MGSQCNENAEYKNYRKNNRMYAIKNKTSRETQVKWMDRVEGHLKSVKIIGWRAKVEDRQEWNRIVEQTKTHRGL